MTFDEYKKIRALNASCLKKGRKSMLALHHAMTQPQSEPTDSMRFGTLAHKAIFEPAEFDDLVKVFDGDKRTAAWKEFKKENADNMEFVVTGDEKDALAEMSAVLHANKYADELISSCIPEYSITWKTDLYGNAKARLDGLSCKHGIVEYKTAKDITEKWFFKQIVSLGYDLAAGWYVEAVEKATKSGVLPFTFIVQENEKPYDIAIYKVPIQMIELGRGQAIRLAMQYRECEKTGVFTGYQAAPKELELPDWYGNEEMGLQLGVMSAEYL